MPRKQSPTPTAMVPVVLATLMQIIAAHRPACRQERTFRRAVALLVGELVAFARQARHGRDGVLPPGQSVTVRRSDPDRGSRS